MLNEHQSTGDIHTGPPLLFPVASNSTISSGLSSATSTEKSKTEEESFSQQSATVHVSELFSKFIQRCPIELSFELFGFNVNSIYSRTRMEETRIKETFGYKKRFHSSAFKQDKLSNIDKTTDKRNYE